MALRGGKFVSSENCAKAESFVAATPSSDPSGTCGRPGNAPKPVWRQADAITGRVDVDAKIRFPLQSS